MNTGFYTRAKSINTRKFDNKSIRKLQMDKEVPYHTAILSPFFLDLAVHYIAKSPQAICNKMYFNDNDPDAFCEECLKPGYKNKGLNRPSLVRVMLGYVFDLVGAKGVTSKGTEFDHNPLKIIQISSGLGQENFSPLNDANVGKFLQFDPAERNIWKLKAKETGGMQAPTLVSPIEFKSLPHLKKAEIPGDIWDKYSTMPKQEVEGILLSAFVNLNREYLEGLGIILQPSDDFFSNNDSEDSSEDDM